MFTCVAQGVPEPRLVWLKNGKVLSPRDNIRLAHDNTCPRFLCPAPAPEVGAFATPGMCAHLTQHPTSLSSPHKSQQACPLRSSAPLAPLQVMPTQRWWVPTLDRSVVSEKDSPLLKAT